MFTSGTGLTQVLLGTSGLGLYAVLGQGECTNHEAASQRTDRAFTTCGLPRHTVEYESNKAI